MCGGVTAIVALGFVILAVHLAMMGGGASTPEALWQLLAAGTDGTDGPTEDAGAIVDAGTIGLGQCT